MTLEPSRLGTARALLRAIDGSNEYESDVFFENMFDFIEGLRAEEVEELPDALNSAMYLVKREAQKARLLARLAVELDLYECLPGVLALCERFPFSEVVVALARLSAHPCAGRDSAVLAHDILQRQSVEAQSREAAHLFMTWQRAPAGDLQVVARAQAWPGVSEQAPLLPIVYIDQSSTALRDQLMVGVAVKRRGGECRRFNADPEPATFRAWLAPQPVIVTGDAERTLQTMRACELPTSTARIRQIVGPLSRLTSGRLLAWLQVQFGPSLRALSDDPLVGAASPLSSEAMRVGAFDAQEMAYLGSASKDAVYGVAREALTPIRSTNESMLRWRFQQLIALRVTQYFRQVARIRSADVGAVLRGLESLAGAPESASVGVQADGSVFVQDDEGWYNIQNGARSIAQVIELDTVFAPIELGARRVPALLQPAPSVEVNPTIAEGTPVVRGTRLPARAIAQLSRGLHAAPVSEIYPYLEAAQVTDAVRVGTEIDLVR